MTLLLLLLLLLLLGGHREACLIIALLVGLEEMTQKELGSLRGVEGCKACHLIIRYVSYSLALSLGPCWPVVLDLV